MNAMRKKMMLMLVVTLVTMATICRISLAEEPEVLDTERTEARDGCTMVGVPGSFLGNQQDVLDRVNEIRLEACKEGVPNPNTKKPLTMADYVPIKWSTELEFIARIRAVETRFIVAHERNNGVSHWFSYNGVSPSGEILAWNYASVMNPGYEQFYEEKEDWLKACRGESHGVYGHYTALINPNNRYIGAGGFVGPGLYGATTSGELSGSNPSGNTYFLPIKTNVIQKMEVQTSYLSNYSLTGSTALYIGDSVKVDPKVTFTRDGRTFELLNLNITKYTSSNTAVASVDASGKVTALKGGTVTIKAYEGSTERGSLTITIAEGGRDLTTATIKLSASRFQYDGTAKKPLVTVTHEGTVLVEGVHYTVKYADNTDLGTATITVTGKGNCTGTKQASFTIYCDHNCSFSVVEGEAKVTGFCTRCNRQVTEALPTSFITWWRATTSGYYYSTIPQGIEKGKKLYLWIDDVDGYKDFKEMKVESSDPSVLYVPDGYYGEGIYPLDVLNDGVVTLSIYSKWNPSCKKTYTIYCGLLDIAGVSKPSLSSMVYTGAPRVPSTSRLWLGSISLSEGTDYTVTYSDNVNAGTCTVTYTGIGRCKGTYTTTFEILPNSSAVKGAFSLIGQDGVLSDKLCLRYYVTVDESKLSAAGTVDPYVVIKIAGQKTKLYLKDMEQKEKNGKNAYLIPCYMNAKEMNDPCYLEFFANPNYTDGSVSTSSYKNSMKAYLDSLISSYSYSAAAKTLARTMLNYGTYSQLYFGYETDYPANRTNSTKLSAAADVLTALGGVEGLGVDGYNASVAYMGCSMLLHADTGMRFYFSGPDSAFAGVSGFQKNLLNGYWYTETAPANILALNTRHNISFGGYRISGGPLQYIKLVLLTSNDEKLRNLCIAMYDYYKAAEAYEK